MSAPACASQIDPHTLPSLETFELTRRGCRQADKMTVKWWKDARRDDQISQKQHSVPPRQTSHIFGNVVSCCFQMMWRSLCQELSTTAPRVSWNRQILIFVFIFFGLFFCMSVFVQGCVRGTILGRHTALPSTPTQSSSLRKLWPPKSNTRRYTNISVICFYDWVILNALFLSLPLNIICWFQKPLFWIWKKPKYAKWWKRLHGETSHKYGIDSDKRPVSQYVKWNNRLYFKHIWN